MYSFEKMSFLRISIFRSPDSRIGKPEIVAASRIFLRSFKQFLKLLPGGLYIEISRKFLWFLSMTFTAIFSRNSQLILFIGSNISYERETWRATDTPPPLRFSLVKFIGVWYSLKFLLKRNVGLQVLLAHKLIGILLLMESVPK